MFTVSHDYYGILGVSKNATPEEIKEQYRKLIKEHHPDQFMGLRAKYQGKGDEDLLKVIDEKIREAGEKCKLINEAFEVLSDPVKRKQYDEQVVEPSVPLPEISIHPTRIAFGSLLEGQKKSLAFTIENKGGPPATVNIDWEKDKPDWGELVIEPDVENVFPIKVTVKADTTGIPSGPKDDKILVDVDGRIHMVEVFLAVTRPVVAPATPATPTRTYSSPTPPTKTSLTVPAILGAILVLVVIVIGGIRAVTRQAKCIQANLPERVYDRGYHWTVRNETTLTIPGSISGTLQGYSDNSHRIRFEGKANQVIDISIEPGPPSYWDVILTCPNGDIVFSTETYWSGARSWAVSLPCSGMYNLYVVPGDEHSRSYTVTIKVR